MKIFKIWSWFKTVEISGVDTWNVVNTSFCRCHHRQNQQV